MPQLKMLTCAAQALLLAIASVLVFGCSGRQTSEGGAIRLQGAGATFPNPLYQKWLSEYGKINPGVRIDYQAIGSGGGIKQIKEQTIDFGASDTPMSDADLQSAPGRILHLPMVLGAVVLTYNLPEAKEPLRFSPDIIADIFLGKIRTWDDARIKADNAGAALPSAAITVVRRSDGSGTSAVFTDYLSKVSDEWKQKVGSGTSPNWPVGLGGKGNDGVTGLVEQTPNTIGYIELAYAVTNRLPVARIKNSTGNFVEPSLDNVMSAAAGSVAQMPEDLRVSITNASGAQAYPISSYTYILAYQEQKDAAKGKAFVDFLWWCIHDGERFAKDLQYAPLPEAVVKKAEAALHSITSSSKPLRAAR